MQRFYVIEKLAFSSSDSDEEKIRIAVKHVIAAANGEYPSPFHTANVLCAFDAIPSADMTTMLSTKLHLAATARFSQLSAKHTDATTDRIVKLVTRPEGKRRYYIPDLHDVLDKETRKRYAMERCQFLVSIASVSMALNAVSGGRYYTNGQTCKRIIKRIKKKLKKHHGIAVWHRDATSMRLQRNKWYAVTTVKNL